MSRVVWCVVNEDGSIADNGECAVIEQTGLDVFSVYKLDRVITVADGQYIKFEKVDTDEPPALGVNVIEQVNTKDATG